MKTAEKILALLFALLVVLSFGACKNPDDSPAIDSGTDNNTGNVDIPANGDNHVCNWSVASVIQEESCVQDGIIEYSCTCGEHKTEIEKADGHIFSEWEKVTASTCNKVGEDKRTCSVCTAEDIKTVDKLTHDYTVTEEEVNGVLEKEFLCSHCSDSFSIASTLVEKFEGIEEQRLFDCESDFSFEIICGEDESYIRENLKIFDAYFEDTEYEDHEDVVCGYNLTETEDNVWTVTPAASYEAGTTYKAARTGGVAFKDYGLGDLTFSIFKEETNEIELNEGVIFLQTLENANPGYYPYTLDYSENSDVYWLTLGKIDGLKVGDIICVGEATSLDGVLNSEPDSNLFGEIISISHIEASGYYLVEIKFPDIDVLFSELDIHQTGVEAIITEQFTEELKAEAVNALLESEDFVKFLAASYQTSVDYISKNQLVSSVDTLNSFLEKITVTPYIPNFSGDDSIDSFKIGIELKGNIPIDIKQSATSDVVSGKIYINFNAGITLEFNTTVILKCYFWTFSNENVEEFEKEENKEKIYFDFRVKQTTTTFFTFDVEITGEDSYSGDFASKILEKIKSGELDEAVNEIKGYTSALKFEEIKAITKPDGSLPLLVVPVCTGIKLEINVDVYIEFKLYIAMNYEYRTVKEDTYGFTIIRSRLNLIHTKNNSLKTNAVTAIGYSYLELGAIGKISLATSVVPSNKLSATINAKFGIYAEASGGAYWSFVEEQMSDNFLSGRLEIGYRYHIWGSYVCFGIEKKTGSTLNIVPDTKQKINSIEETIAPEDVQDSENTENDGSDITGDTSDGGDISNTDKPNIFSFNVIAQNSLLNISSAMLPVRLAYRVYIPDNFTDEFGIMIWNQRETNCTVNNCIWEDFDTYFDDVGYVFESHQIYADNLTTLYKVAVVSRNGESVSIVSDLVEYSVKKYAEKRITQTSDDPEMQNKYQQLADFCDNPVDGEISNGSSGLEYSLSSDGTYYIVAGIGSCIDTEIVIPDTYNGLPVQEIGAHAFGSCSTITKVTIGDNIQHIKRKAFAACENLSVMVIGRGGKYFDEECFLNTEILICYYKGTAEEWEKNVGFDTAAGGQSLIGATRYYI